MKKITMLLAAIGLAVSSNVFAAEELVKVGEAYVLLKDGTRIEGTLDDLCDASAKDQDTTHNRTVHARFNNFRRSYDGDSVRQLVCWVKGQYLGRDSNNNLAWLPPLEELQEVSVSPFGPARCDQGGLYLPFLHGCFEYQETNL